MRGCFFLSNNYRFLIRIEPLLLDRLTFVLPEPISPDSVLRFERLLSTSKPKLLLIEPLFDRAFDTCINRIREVNSD